MEQYQDVEDQVAREAMDAALSQINEGRLSMTRRMPSFIEAVQQEKAQAEEEWVCLQDTMILRDGSALHTASIRCHIQYQEES
jgi:hypothetical protein